MLNYLPFLFGYLLIFIVVATGMAAGLSGADDPVPTGNNDAELPQAGETPSLRAGALHGEVCIDGILDEPSWKRADAIDDLTMVEPDEGAAPSGKTEVRVLCDRKNLYVGIRCIDSDPAGIVSYSVARDSSLRNEDHVKIVLGTFRNGRSGYVFAVNPSGARYDALVSRRGESENRNWDGIWEAETVRNGTGWTAEIRIPIFTLSFGTGLSAWHFNVERRIQRLLEQDRWAGARRDWRVTQTSRAGLITGLPEFDLGMGLSIRPSLVGSYSRPSLDEDADLDQDVSLDVTQKLGSNLLAQLTVNTDFAETEVDTWRTNLTRFPLFFPEKRSFFLEGSDYFDFGLGLRSDLVPFHSRRIGLVDGEEVPLLLGGKLHGLMGDTNVGALFAQTGEESGVAPETGLGVVRLKQNIWEESTIGFIGTRGDPMGRSNSWMTGADFTYQTSEFLGDKNFLVGVWGLTMDREDLDGHSRSAMGGKIDYPNDLWDIMFTYKRIGEDFDPSLGFVPRKGINKYQSGVDFMPYSDWPWLRRMNYELSTTYITDLNGEWESYRIFMSPLNWELESGDEIEFNVITEGERIDEGFEISDGIDIRTGPYQWTRYRVQAGSASKRSLSGELSCWFGPFYDGRLTTYEAELEWNPVPLLTFQLNGERNVGRIEAGSFAADLYRSKVQFNFSPDFTMSSIVQYDTEGDTVGTNTRLHWSITPSSNLYFVFNYNWIKLNEHWERESYESVAKIEYVFRF